MSSSIPLPYVDVDNEVGDLFFHLTWDNPYPEGEGQEGHGETEESVIEWCVEWRMRHDISTTLQALNAMHFAFHHSDDDESGHTHEVLEELVLFDGDEDESVDLDDDVRAIDRTPGEGLGFEMARIVKTMVKNPGEEI